MLNAYDVAPYSGACPQVDLSIINGEVIVQGGKILSLDVDVLVKEANIVSARICSFILDASKQ